MKGARAWLAFSLFCAAGAGAGGFLAARSRMEPRWTAVPAATSASAEGGTTATAPGHATALAATPAFPAVVTAKLDTMLSAKYPARLLTLLVKPGDRVVAGAVVAEMDRRSLDKLVAAKQAEVAAAQAKLRRGRVVQDLAGKRAKRAEALAELASGEDVERAQHDVAQTAAETAERVSDLQRLSAELEGLRIHLQETALVAPHDGVVTGTFARTAEWVEAGREIVRLVGTERAVRFAVPTSEASAVTVGARMQFTRTDGASPIAVVIASVGRHADAASRMVFAEADLASPGDLGTLIPGLPGTVAK